MHTLNTLPTAYARLQCAAPHPLDDPNTPLLFPADAIERAKKIIASFGTGGVGGYTDSRGNPMIREEVADFIQARDGHRPSIEVRRVEAIALLGGL